MSHEILKNVRISKEKISFEYASNNVFPRYFRDYVMPNTEENREMMKKYLIGRVWQPQGSGKMLYRHFGITHFWDGCPVG